MKQDKNKKIKNTENCIDGQDEEDKDFRKSARSSV